MCKRFRRRKEPIHDGLQRSNVPTRQLQDSAYPMAQAPSQSMPMPNTSAFHVHQMACQWDYRHIHL